MTVNNEYVEWKSVAPKKEFVSGDKIPYLWLKKGNTYKVRPIHMPVHFFKYFHQNEGKLRTAICENPKTDPNYQIRHDTYAELKKPSERYAMYAIDRADGKMKIMEGPPAVFKHFRLRFEATGKKPGAGKEGGDWSITVDTKSSFDMYSVTYLEDTPLSSEEKDLVKEAMNQDRERLQKIYAIDESKDLEKKLFGPFDDSKSSSNNSEVVDDLVDNNENDEDLDF